MDQAVLWEPTASTPGPTSTLVTLKQLPAGTRVQFIVGSHVLSYHNRAGWVWAPVPRRLKWGEAHAESDPASKAL